MTHIVAADRIMETSTTTGTGALTLAGAVTGYRAFSAIPSIAANDTLPYALWGVDSDGIPTGEWETGIGTYNTTLTRTLVVSSSNSDTVVTLSAGTKFVVFGINSYTWKSSEHHGIGRCVISHDFTGNVNSTSYGDLIALPSNSGSYSTGPSANWANHPGVILIRSASGANSGVVFQYASGAVNGTRTFFANDGNYAMDIIFRTPSANTDIVWQFGGMDTVSLTGAPSNGHYFSLAGSSWALESKTTSGGTSTTNSIYTMSANTWYHAKLKVPSGGATASFELFSESGASLGSATHSTNMPGASGIYPCWKGYKSSATAADVLNIDFMSLDLGWSKPLARGRLY